jgi:hypothetical protein
MSTKQFSELSSIHDLLLELTKRITDPDLRSDFQCLAQRLDTEIAITPEYTGDGNELLSDMLMRLGEEMYRKMEAIAMAANPDMIKSMRCMRQCLEERGEDANCDDCD